MRTGTATSTLLPWGTLVAMELRRASDDERHDAAHEAAGRLPAAGPSERRRRWAATMAGFADGIRLAHVDSSATVIGATPYRADGAMTPDQADGGAAPDPRARSGPGPTAGASVAMARPEREAVEDSMLAPGASRARGAGDRRRPEEPDTWRTCFERDRDRILHAPAFRRLAGKTQVFVFPEDHQRTRLTHALEVAQVATGIARALRLNVALTEAIALGHDCGHGPGGHASEDALDPYLPEGFDHAVWGADASLVSLNLCGETLDGIRNHSWSRPAPSTPEGEVVSWADRIAYVCHDWEDAALAGIVAPGQLPEIVRSRCGDRRSQQLGTFIDALVATALDSDRIGMTGEVAEALAAFRACNYERIYLRAASLAQGTAVIAVLRALVEHYADHPNAIPAVREAGGLMAGEPEGIRAAVTYVAGMTDRFAFRQAVGVLGWDPDKLPKGVDG